MKGFAYFEEWLIEGRIGILKELQEEFQLYDQRFQQERNRRIRADSGNNISVTHSKSTDECDYDSQPEEKRGNDFVEGQHENGLCDTDKQIGRLKISSTKRKAELGESDENGRKKRFKIRRLCKSNTDGTGCGWEPKHGSAQEGEGLVVTPATPLLSKEKEGPKMADTDDHHPIPIPFSSESEAGVKSLAVDVGMSQSPDKQLSEEEKNSLLDRIMICLWERKKAVRAIGLEVAASSPHVNEILLSLIRLTHTDWYSYFRDPQLTHLLYKLRLLESLFMNPNANLGLYIKEIRETTYSCTVTSVLPGRPERKEHWEMRALAASLLGRVFKMFPAISDEIKASIVKDLHREDRPINMLRLYGLILIVKELGNETVHTLLLPKVQEIGARVSDCLASTESSPADKVAAQKVESLIVEVTSALPKESCVVPQIG